MTITEAKAQALMEREVPGTGTATDAVCVLAPLDGDAESFAGPRSTVGRALASATHAAITRGSAAWVEKWGRHR
jgi:adenosylcobinamide amidohydrolase